MQHALGRFSQRRLHALLLCAAAIAPVRSAAAASGGSTASPTRRPARAVMAARTTRRLRSPSMESATRATQPSARTRRTSADRAAGAARVLRLPRRPRGQGHCQPHRRARDRDVRCARPTGGASPTWTRDTGSCSATYCHGGTLGACAHRARLEPRRRRGRLRRLPRPPRRRRTCRTRTAAVATSATPRGRWSRPRTWTAGRREAARVQRLPRLGHDRRPTHRHRRRDRHDRPRGRRARAAPARRHHPRPTLLQRVPRPPVRDAPRRRQGRPRLGSARERRGRRAVVRPRERDVQLDLLPWCDALLGDGMVTAPVWTRVGEGQASCGTCHAAPPGFPHPSRMDCSRCHPGTTTADDSRIDVAGGQHIDGTLDIVPVTCTMCHGTEGVNPAPPVGTRGETETSAIAVGAHQKHVQNGPIRKALDCAECHVDPTIPLHTNGTVDLAWGDLAMRTARRRNGPARARRAARRTATARRSPSAADREDADLDGRVGGTTACNSCHGFAPPLPHPQNTNCNRCHEGTVLASGAIDVAGGQHIDGTVQVSAGGYAAVTAPRSEPGAARGDEGRDAHHAARRRGAPEARRGRSDPQGVRVRRLPRR